jgi:predicted HNH restriction endonuclease
MEWKKRVVGLCIMYKDRIQKIPWLEELKRCEEETKKLNQYLASLPESAEYENTKRATLMMLKSKKKWRKSLVRKLEKNAFDKMVDELAKVSNSNSAKHLSFVLKPSR